MENHKEIEFRVRPVTRYIVTRFIKLRGEKGTMCGSSTRGEFDNAAEANEVALALGDSERLCGELNVTVITDVGNVSEPPAQGMVAE